MNIFVTLKTKRWSRIVLTLSKILVVIGIIGFVLHLILTSPNLWDPKTVNDADLQFEKITSKDSENVANFLPVINKATDAELEILDRVPLYENGQFYKINKFSEKEVMSELELEKYMADSKLLVEKFVVASTKSYYHCPYDVYASPRPETCYTGNIWSFAMLASIHVKYALSINDVNRAQMLVTALFNVGQMVSEQKSPIGSIEFLSGVGIMVNAIALIESNSDLQRIFQPTINEYTLPDDVLRRPMIAEYHLFKSGINHKEVLIEEGFGAFTKNPSYSWRPNTTANLYAEYIRTAIVAYATPCDVEPDYSKLEAMRAEFRKDYDRLSSDTYNSILNSDGTFLKLNIKPNIIGKLILVRASQDLSNLRNEKCDLNERIEKLAGE